MKRAQLLQGLLIFSVLICLSACRTVPPLAPINLQEPGWTTREGQAVWRMKRDAPEIAGEILIATRLDGQEFVQFSKNPFPMMSALSSTNPSMWQVEVPIQNKRYSGRGQPPARLILLYLPRVLSGQPPPKGWLWQKLENNGWRLENRSTGEMLEGYFEK